VCKVIHPSLKSSDPFHHTINLVSPITSVPLRRKILVEVLGRGRGSGSVARLQVTMREVVTTTLMVTQEAAPIHNVPLGLMRVSLRYSRGLLRYLQESSPASARWSCEAMARLSHPIALRPYIIDRELSGSLCKMYA
jgi:hypothetical protein